MATHARNLLRSGAVSALALSLVGAPALRASAASWPVFGFDASRSGFNSLERSLTVGNVNHLHERWQIALGSVADSTPILLQHVRVGRAYRNVLFQTTKSGDTVAIEARSGRILWRFDTHGVNYTHSTPAADPSGKAIYVPGIDGKVHKLSAAKGRELSAPGFPAVVTRAPSTEAVESPLNVANGYLYATTSGYNGDGTPYDGHVVAINLQNGKRSVFNSLCSNRHKLIDPGSCTEQRSGIWARGGAVVDPDPSMNGRVYASTGNGDFNANTGGSDYGDSTLSLSNDLRDLLGSYTPTDYKGLDQGDVDLGSTSPVMLAAQPSSQTPLMLAQGGKDAMLKLVNRAAMPGVGGELQIIDLPNGLFSTPASWTDPSGNGWIFLGFNDVVDAFRLQTNGSGVSKLNGIWQATPGSTGGEGTSPVVANGIVFVAFDGAIVALNAVNGGLLWSSAQSSAGKTIGHVHWQSPIVVNGSVYCSDQNGNLTAYSLR